MLSDTALLDRYARERDESAFAELVRRYLNLVYSAAVRRIGDRHLAEDVTQAVFMILSKKARSAGRTSPLSAWLLMTVRYAAANALKIERRRQQHQTAAAEASASAACSPNPSDVLVWREVAAHIDDAMLKLPARDRQAVLLRYFEDKPIRDVAAAMNTSEGAAKQRLSRSLEKLRKRLDRHQVSLALEGAAGLGALLTAHAVRAAPPALITTCAAGSAASAASITITKGAIAMMTFAKIKTVAAILFITSALGTGVFIATQQGVQAQDQANVAAGPTPTQLRQRAEARVQAAQEVVAALDARARANEPLLPPFVELRAMANRRLTEARIDATDDLAARFRFAEQHVQQCRDTLAMLKLRMGAGGDVSSVQVAQMGYHLADAEYLVAKLRVGR
jgi:RNA polymerase sigma factor (sigma-70 family)